MGIWENILTVLLISFAVPLAISFIWGLKVRGEKKISTQGVVRTRPPKVLSGFFLGFGLVVLFGGIAAIIYCCITDSENTTITTVVIISVCIALFSSLGFFGYAYVRFNYVVADEEGIYSYRLFRRTRYYRYEEIGSFKDTIDSGMIGGLIGYDKDNKKIFAIEAVHIGSSAVARKLREHGVPERYTNSSIINL